MKKLGSDKLIRKTVYRSLLTSVACLLLLLVGLSAMTFAYFSDGETNEENSISAGSFDVDVYLLNDGETSSLIENSLEETSFNVNSTYRFVKKGNTAGYFKAQFEQDSIIKYCYGVFDEDSNEDSYFDLLVNTNGESTFKIVEINWGIPNVEEHEKLEGPVLLSAPKNDESAIDSVVYLEKDKLNEIDICSTYLRFDPNISRLNDGYQEIEYLELNGFQHLDISLSPSADLKFIVNSENSIENLAYIETIGINDQLENILEYKFKVNEDGSVEFINVNGASIDTINLFGRNINGNIEGNYIGKVYSISILENDSLLYELVPCKYEENYGLYDLLSDSFYKLEGEYVNTSNKVASINGKIIKNVEIEELQQQEIKYNDDNLYLIENDGYMVEGLTFKGYSLTRNGEILIPNENGQYYIEVNNEKTITLYAVWEIIEFNINYELDGGELENPTSKYNLFENVVFAVPLKSGYIFGGYYIDPEFREQIFSTDGHMGDLTVFVKWIVEEKEEVIEETVLSETPNEEISEEASNEIEDINTDSN